MSGKGYTVNGMRKIVPNVKQTLMNADGEGATIDVLGEIRQIERGLSALRRGTQVEFDSRQRGKVWEIVVPKKNERSYNTPRIIQKFAEAMDVGAWFAFVMLWKSDVVRLEWQFKKLMAKANEFDVTIATAQHEIIEGDDADIGVYPVDDYPKYEEID